MSKRTAGFTIVELSIAIAFLGILMMAIVTLSMTAGKLYVKGNTNKAINQAGRDIADTIRRDFLAAGADKIIHPTDIVVSGVPTATSGRICVGQVAYLWNSADMLNATSTQASGKRITIGGTAIKFVRITGNGVSTYCTLGAVVYPATPTATELLGGSGVEYALHTVSFTQLAQNNRKGVYHVAYQIGTNDLGTTQTVGGYVSCRPNDSVLANFNYCSVASFDTLVRVGGSV